jgi:hypothetical protein
MNKELPKCNDCGKVLSRYDAKRCKKCYSIWLKDNRKFFNFSIRDKENNSNYRHGKTYNNHCVDCNALLGNYRSKRCKSCSRKGKLHWSYGKIPNHGTRIKYKEILFRSSYEVKYAQYLDQHNTKWLYESKTFDLGDTTYTPDFYLPETDTYIEIKGYWRQDAKEKFILFKRIYFDIKIIILEKQDLINLGINI